VTGAVVRDLESQRGPIEVRAKVVVNATGVWTDEVRALGEPDRRPTMRPAKGVHVTVPASRFPADIAAVIPVRGDRRSIFVVPWPEADLVYLGTTDTDYDGDLDDPRCTAEDVGYLLAAANAVSRAELTPADVTGVWAGLRPLLAPASGRFISERTADLSRRHKVWRDDDGMVTVTGGKLTTYRKMAEDTVDLAVATLPGPRRRSVTKDLALEGSPALGTGSEAPGAPAPHLARRYGTLAGRVAALAEGRDELLSPIAPGLPYLGAEIVYAARQEMAVHLDDALARRTRAAIQDAGAALAGAEAAAALMGAELGWDDRRRRDEVARFAELVRSDLDAAGLSPSTVRQEDAR